MKHTSLAAQRGIFLTAPEINHQLKICILDTKENNPNHYLVISLAESLRRHPDVSDVYLCKYNNAIDIAVKNNCNLFLAFDGEEADLNICSRLASICAQSIVWFTEDPYEIEANIRTSKIFDLVFTNDLASVQKYGPKGRHLPLGAFMDFHFHDVSKDEDCLYDVLFIGTAWPNRVSFLKELIPLVPNLRLKIALPTNQYLPTFDLPLPKFEYNWKTTNLEFARIANKSKITLSLHREFSGSGENQLASTPGPRLFETALAGGFQMIDSCLIEVEKYYSPNVDVVTFNNPQDCAKQINYFIANKELRTNMARSAQVRTQKEHLYSHRINRIISEIRSLPKKANQIVVGATSKKTKVLFFTHNTIKASSFGGVEVYQDFLIKNLSEKFEFYFLAPTNFDQMNNSEKIVLLDSSYKKISEHTFAKQDSTLRSETRELWLKELLLRHDFQLVHFQHLMGFPSSFPLIVKQLGIPSIFTAHDYFLACSNFNLINYQGQFCQADRNDLQKCDACLFSSNNITPGYQALRRSFNQHVLNSFDHVIFNTQGVQTIFENFFTTAAKSYKSHIIPPPIKAHSGSISKDYSGLINIACLGNFASNKGATEMLATFKILEHRPFRFHIFGHLHDAIRDKIQSLNFKNVLIHGPYGQNEIPEILSEMHLSLHLSIWPETYCLALSEAWQSGLIPIVTDIGALGERVIDFENGYKIKVGDTQHLLEIFDMIAQHPHMLAHISKRISPNLWADEASHLAKIAALYENALARETSERSVDQLSIFNVNRVNSIGYFIYSAVDGGGQIMPRPSASLVGKISRLSKATIVTLKQKGVRVTARKIVRKLNGKFHFSKI